MVNHPQFSEIKKWTGAFVFLTLSACSSTSSHLKSGRFVSSSDGICTIEHDESVSFEKFTNQLVSSGSWKKEDQVAALGWSKAERRSAVVRAFAETYVYGEVLKKDFDRLIQKGFTIEKLSKRDAHGNLRSTVYARLMALRTLKETLLELARNQLASDLEEYRKPDWSKEQLVSAVQIFLRKYGEEIVAAASQSVDSRLSELALDELKNLAGDVEKYYESCNPDVFGETAEDRRPEIQKALSFQTRLSIDAFRRVQPQTNSPRLNIQTITNHRANRKDLNFDVSSTRRPQSADIYYPDLTYHGNVVGGAFPKGVWALTFDDGPAKTTAQVLDHLKKQGVQATFFMLSQQILPGAYLKTALRIRDEGHAIACHSFTHAQIPKLDAAGIDYEINGAAKVFHDVFGEKPKFFRLPYGSGLNVSSVRKIIMNAGMIHVFWNVDTLDWQDKNPDSIYARTLAQMKSVGGHGVILFHDIHPQSVVASEKVMRYLKDPANHLCAATIPTIIESVNAEANGESPKPICAESRQ